MTTTTTTITTSTGLKNRTFTTASIVANVVPRLAGTSRPYRMHPSTPGLPYDDSVQFPPLFRLTRIRYIIVMGWRRWGRAARRKWVTELLLASMDTANACREWLAADNRLIAEERERNL